MEKPFESGEINKAEKKTISLFEHTNKCDVFNEI